MQTVLSYLGILRRFGQKFGPYLLVEMLLPGGTLLALMLFLYRRGTFDIGGGVQGAVFAVKGMLATLFEQRVLVPVPVTANVRVSKSRPDIRL